MRSYNERHGFEFITYRGVNIARVRRYCGRWQVFTAATATYGAQYFDTRGEAVWQAICDATRRAETHNEWRHLLDAV